MIELQQELELGEPQTILEPTINDPLWWFVYRQTNGFLCLGANKEQVGRGGQKTDLDLFYYANFFKLLPVLPSSSDNRTYCTASCSISVTNRMTEYLVNYNMREPTSIRGIEEVLGLGSPHESDPGGFVFPMHTFSYVFSNCWIKLYGRPLRSSISGERIESRDYLFTGYWDTGPVQLNSTKNLK